MHGTKLPLASPRCRQQARLPIGWHATISGQSPLPTPATPLSPRLIFHLTYAYNLALGPLRVDTPRQTRRGGREEGLAPAHAAAAAQQLSSVNVSVSRGKVASSEPSVRVRVQCARVSIDPSSSRRRAPPARATAAAPGQPLPGASPRKVRSPSCLACRAVPAGVKLTSRPCSGSGNSTRGKSRTSGLPLRVTGVHACVRG